MVLGIEDDVRNGGIAVVRWIYDNTIGVIVKAASDLLFDVMMGNLGTISLEVQENMDVLSIILMMGLLVFVVLWYVLDDSEEETTYSYNYMAAGAIIVTSGTFLYEKYFMLMKATMGLVFGMSSDPITALIALILACFIVAIIGSPFLIAFVIILALHQYVLDAGHIVIQLCGVFLLMPIPQVSNIGEKLVKMFTVNMTLGPIIALIIMITLYVSKDAGINVFTRAMAVIIMFIAVGIVTYYLYTWAFSSSKPMRMTRDVSVMAGPAVSGAGRAAVGAAGTIGGKVRRGMGRIPRSRR